MKGHERTFLSLFSPLAAARSNGLHGMWDEDLGARRAVLFNDEPKKSEFRAHFRLRFTFPDIE